jgi:hypothetical protein
MDHVSTHSHPPIWYVAHHAQTCTIDSVESIEAKAGQTATQQPNLRTNPQTPICFYNAAIGASSSCPPADSVDILSDDEFRARVEQSVALSLNPRTEDKTEASESIEKDIDAPPRSAGDLDHTV